MTRGKAIVIGAGPAGLTAAYEFLKDGDTVPVVFEESTAVGGLSRTEVFKGNRMDIGGHRFFSKVDRVMDWWREILPLQGAPARDDILLGREVPLSTLPDAPDPEQTDRVMLTRRRISRIFYLRKFFDYPVTLNRGTVVNLGAARMARAGMSYAWSQVRPIRPERSLEDFFINRFGHSLYATFFRDYTTKVWGVPPSMIKAEWGSQRVKGLSVSEVLKHAVRSLATTKEGGDIHQKRTETSLIGRFMYPKFGPGQLWEEVAHRVRLRGGEIHFNQRVVALETENSRVRAVIVEHSPDGHRTRHEADHFLSTMPVQDLVAGLQPAAPHDIQSIAAGLQYRDFITVGLLCRRLKIRNHGPVRTVNDVIPDLWIYVQERDVRIGRFQIFNNWSPYLAADPSTTWLGLEYFCTQGDDLWRMPKDDFRAFAIGELAHLGILDPADVLDGTVIKVKKTYPAYFGSYDDFPRIREYLDGFENLFLIGRNGMHKYNNQDHSMLTAMTAVENIRAGRRTKDNIWAVNTEEEYHEEKRDVRRSAS